MLNKIQAVLSIAESYIGKRKLIALFGSIVITSRNHLINLSKYTTDKIDLDKQESEDLKIKYEKEKDLINDNKNSGNLTKCWNVEKFSIIDQCIKCDSFSNNFLIACKDTGYKETLKCEKYGQVSRSCSVPKHVIIKRYWSFEVVCVCLAMVFTSIVISRKRFLDNIAYERVRKQLLS